MIETHQFIDEFFAAPNILRARMATVVPFIELAQAGREVAILPYVAASDGPTAWYLAARDTRSAKALADSVMAALGQGFRPAPVADVRSAALNAAGYQAVAVVETTPTDRDTTRRRIERTARLLLQAPIVSATTRPTRRLLADLEDAVACGRLGDAREALSEIRASGRLSTANIAFLDIRCQAAEQSWADIMRRPDLEDVLASRPPRQIAAAILEAAYQTYLSAAKAPDEMVRLFSERVRPLVAPLLIDPRSASTPGAVVVWAAHAASGALAGPTVDALRASARAVECVPSFARDLLERPIVSVTSLSIADLIRDGDYLAAWSQLTGLPDGDAGAGALLAMAECAIEVDDPIWIATVIARFDALIAQVAEVPRRLRVLVEELRLSVKGASGRPDGWDNWAEALAQGGDADVLVGVAHARAGSWSSSTLTPVGTEALVTALEAGAARADAVRDVRGWLLPVVLEGSLPPSSRRRLSQTFMQAIFLGPRIGGADAAALLRIAEAIVEEGMDAADEADLIDALAGTATRLSAPGAAGWAIDILEALSQGEMTPHRTEACRTVASSLLTHVALLSAEQRAAINEACVAMGLPAMAGQEVDAHEADATGVWPKLSDRRIFIYTLDEQVARRASDALLARCPGARVETWSERDADRRMCNAAAVADIVVISTRVAKHAATGGIERSIEGRGSALYPSGTGWSSIVEAVGRAAQELV